MKVLFLDIDGVVNSKQDAMVTRGVLGINRDQAFIVGKIILDTGARLVISSTWRNWDDGLQQIRDQIYPHIYSITPRVAGGFRGSEVRAWLDKHQEVTDYAILDDDSDFYDDQPLFQTSWDYGITEEIAKEVTDYLNAGAPRHAK